MYSIIRMGGAAACHRDRSAGGGVEPTRFLYGAGCLKQNKKGGIYEEDDVDF